MEMGQSVSCTFSLTQLFHRKCWIACAIAPDCSLLNLVMKILHPMVLMPGL